MFDIKSFLEEYNIEYVESGPNVSQGNININCCWCDDDPSQHLGINLTSLVYGCWRNTNHRGNQISYLVAKLVGCSLLEAQHITGQNKLTLDFNDKINKLLENNEDIIKEKKYEKLELPKNFIPIKNKGNGKKFFNYLIDRKFNKKDISLLIQQYDLRYCMSGRWAYRIILPLWFNHDLISWTARSILIDERLRYKTLTTNYEKAINQKEKPALESTTNILFNYDKLKENKDGNKKDLYIVEGPFDAMKIDFYGHEINKYATCLFTSTLSIKQKELLSNLSNKYNFYILLDRDEILKSNHICKQLNWLHPTIINLPNYLKDPGDMTKKDIFNLL